MFLIDSVQTASDLTYLGDYAGAISALGNSWAGIGLEPVYGGESEIDYARLLLVSGMLTVEMGRLTSVPAQGAAKDLLSKSCRLFGDDTGAYEALLWLSLAYLWSGENREAVDLADSILTAQIAESEFVFRAGIVKGLAYLNLGEFSDAEDSFNSVQIFLTTVSPVARGKFFLNRGMLFRQTDRPDDALADYEHADHAFRESECLRFQAAVQNNFAGIFTDQGRFSDAHASAQRALHLFELIGDLSHEAKVWDQIALIFEREENFEEMARCSTRAVEILSAGDHGGWLAEALITQGKALSRLGMARAQESLMRAISICDRQGDPKQAEIATTALWGIVQKAEEMQESLKQASLPIERSVYERVLSENDGRVTPAARTLGCHHNSLQFRLENRFPDLLSKRRASRKRNKTQFRSR